MKIRPVSDLRNKYPEIEESILREDDEIYLTKNGYGTMVLVGIDKYEKMKKRIQYDDYVEYALDEADEEAEKKGSKLYTHKEMFDKLRRSLDE